MLEKVERLLSKMMGGNATDRAHKRIWPIVEKINEYVETYQELTDDELKAKTHEFRYRLRMGETVDDILPEAFAVVKDTCRRLVGKKWDVRGYEIEWDMIPYDVQLLGGVVLHEGKIAEMATGEGKTLVASAPLYLNALEGKGAHLITVNEYLAQRDCEWMGQIYKFLGLTVAAIHNEMTPEQRRAAYNADITYGTNNEFGFDYLRDNMAVDVWSVVQRGLHYAIVDEVDSVLIDEARTPLIISGAVGAPRNIYNELKPVVSNIYNRQKELVAELFQKGKSLLESDEELAGLYLLRAHRGDPKNQGLLDLLTSEFWVKKLIERIQGQYDINKTMHEVDAELYYTIDEKSHVIDITEKGRIFLSGGHAQDIASKIKVLDFIDDKLNKLGEQKDADKYFTQNAMGVCNGLNFEGQAVLTGVESDVSEELVKQLDALDARLRSFPDFVGQQVQKSKSDKNSVWRKYFKFSKRMDKAVNGFGENARDYLLGENSDSQYKEIVDGFEKLLDLLKGVADVDGGFNGPKHQQDRRREYQNTFFACDKQFGSPIGLTDAGKSAIISIVNDGDPFAVPFIAKIQDMLAKSDGSGLDDTFEYFEFSDNQAFIKHVTEKGRILLLGGNPDLYILPDRGNVEDRDQKIQKLLDQTLNQSTFDYTEKVTAVEELEKDVKAIYGHISAAENPQVTTELFYNISDSSAYRTIQLSEAGKGFFSNFAQQARSIVFKLDETIRKNRSDLSAIFEVDSKNRIDGLKDELLDNLTTQPFGKMKTAISAWQSSHESLRDGNPISLRLDLDNYLASQFENIPDDISLSRQFEETERIDRVMKGIFRAIKENDLAGAEVQRLLKRYFEFDNDLDENELTLDIVKFNGLSEAGIEILVGSVDERGKITEKLDELLKDSDDENALFGLDDNSRPVKLRKSTCSLLLDGLPYFGFSDEFGSFREEVLKLSSKKVNNRSELEGLLPKEKSHMRGMGIMLDDREMNELISKAHAQNAVFTAEEIEHWFRIHLERKPRRILEEQRDKQWREYNDVEERVQNISQLLRAYTLYQKDVDYVVKAVEDTDMRGRSASARGKKAVMIVDQFTGRLMAGRRFSDGLHEALEAKEGVEVQAESQTLATITLQNFFRLFNKLAGMTGTAETEAQEFFSTYGIDVIVVPTNRPVVRDDRNDVIYRTKKEKYDAIISEAVEAHENGQPVLIGTVSVDVSQRISEQFTVRGIPIANWLKKGDVSKELESGRFHTVLNAKFHKQEAEIVAKAGLPGAITIATNMAGRGTDIKLRPEVIEAGGLHIIGSEKHEARRIDRQLRGRSGRQGDPGSSRFYLSLEDDLMRLFGSDRVTNIMSRMGSMEDGERIEHPLITKSIERAQKKVEERNFEIRKNLLEYDNVLNEQRKIIYKRRQNLLGFADATDFIESKSKLYFSADEERAEWQLEELINDLKTYFGIDPDFTIDELEQLEHKEIKEHVETWIQERIDEQRHLSQLQERHRLFGYANMNSILKELVQLKIKLHNAGTTDTTKWNFEGLEGELVRIFGDKPDWLIPNGAKMSAEEIDEKLISWGISQYENLQNEHKELYAKLTFAQLSLDELFDIYLFALVENHLSSDVAEISWNVDAFLQDLERVFEQLPPIGSKEIRTIRRSKLVEAITDWRNGLQIKTSDALLRHRILGYLGLQPLVGIISRFAVNGFIETNGKIQELTKENEQFLQKCFGISLEKTDTELSLAEDVFNQAREVYLGVLKESASAYNALLLGDATTEELVEAGILSISQAVISSSLPLDEKRKNLGSTLEYVFLSKPQKTIPDSTDVIVLSSFREDLVAWGLNLYKLYSDRSERIRQERLSGEIIRDSIYMWIDETIYNMISNALGEGDDLDVSQVRRIEADCRLVFRHAPRLTDESDVAMNPTVVKNELTAWAKNLYKQRVQQIGEDLAVRYERYYTLEKIDENWRQHLAAIDDMREGIGLRGYGQKDPLLEYKSEAYKMFVKMVEDTSKSVVSILFKVFDIGGEIEERQIRRVEPKNFVTSHSQVEVFKQAMSSQGQKQASQPAPGQAPPRNKPVVKQTRVGRNEPCPCGSGKKYKNCCGKNA